MTRLLEAHSRHSFQTLKSLWASGRDKIQTHFNLLFKNQEWRIVPISHRALAISSCLHSVCFENIWRHGIDMDEIFLLSTFLLWMGDWASQSGIWLNGAAACSNLKPIFKLLQLWNEAVLFSTCLGCCWLIDTALGSSKRSASWYKVMAVS